MRNPRKPTGHIDQPYPRPHETHTNDPSSLIILKKLLSCPGKNQFNPICVGTRSNLPFKFRICEKNGRLDRALSHIGLSKFFTSLLVFFFKLLNDSDYQCKVQSGLAWSSIRPVNFRSRIEVLPKLYHTCLSLVFCWVNIYIYIALRTF